MVWTVDKFGLAQELSDISIQELDQRFPGGAGLHATLAGVIRDHKIAATAFAQAISAVPYYDGVDAMAARQDGRSLSDLQPVSIEAEYKVESLDGEIFSPPLKSVEAHEIGYAKMLKETGQRIWQIAALETEELTIFFSATDRRALVRDVWDAVQKLYPDARSLYSALRDEPGARMTLGTALCEEKPSYAIMLRDPDGSATFFAGMDLDDLQGKVLDALPAGDGDIFEIAEETGKGIELGYIWLSDGLVDQAIADRKEREEGLAP